MPSKEHQQESAALPKRARDAVLTFEQPACAADAATGLLIAANPAAEALLGSAGAGLETALSACPPRTGKSVLAFRTLSGGLRTFVCDVRELSAPSRAFLIVLESHEQVPRDSGATDDSATLRKIARRIREGFEARAPTDPHDGDVRGPAPETREAPRGTAPVFEPAFEPGETARVAHEIKTPIGAIAAAAEVMRDERLGPIGSTRYRDYAADIVSNAHHALAVIDRMLATTPALSSDKSSTRRVSGSDDAGAEPATDPNTAAEAAMSAILPLAKRSGRTLEMQLEQRLPLLKADPTIVRQILLNLLTNALKFTEPGGHIRLATSGRPGGAVIFDVSDSGCGMTRAEIARLLDRMPPPAPGARMGGGLGIGLPLVRELAEENGAVVSIDSVLGRGTTVSVVFPARRTVEAIEPASARS
jgi:hypothetical protein